MADNQTGYLAKVNKTEYVFVIAKNVAEATDTLDNLYKDWELVNHASAKVINADDKQ